MSFKDQFNIKGLDSTLGYVCNAFTPAKSVTLLVHTLKQLGAIIIAKTNLPQSIMVKQALQIWDSIGFTDWTSGVRLTTRYGVRPHIQPIRNSLLGAPPVERPLCWL